jgi:hypothetical protein
MGTIIITSSSAANLEIPISFIFWGYVVAYVIHLIDEALIGETFVGMVRKLFWPKYEWKHFFGFNTMLMLLLIISIIMFEIFNGLWIIAPLSAVFLFVTNGMWHLISTIITKKYSPGLATSLIYWILFYFLIRYSFLTHDISKSIIIISAAIGTIITAIMMSSFFIFRKKFKQ